MDVRDDEGCLCVVVWMCGVCGVGNTYKFSFMMSCMVYEVSGAMMVSRNKHPLHESLTSLGYSHIDDLVLWVDESKVSMSDIEIAVENAGLERITTLKPQVNYGSGNHHDNITATFHEMIKTAKHPVVAISDDDFFTQDVRLYAPFIYHNKNIAVFYGDVLARYSDGTEKLRESKPITHPHQGNMMRGSCQIYNRDAFTEASKYIDINTPDSFDEKPIWFGYFLDWQPAYWLKRLEYDLLYTNKVFCIQNVNPDPPNKRTDLYGKWKELCEYYDAIICNDVFDSVDYNNDWRNLTRDFFNTTFC